MKIGIIASRGGTNFEAIVQSTIDGILKDKAEVVVLISNKAGAFCIERAKRLGIPHHIVESDNFKGTREEFDQKLIEILSKYQCDLIALAGYTRLVSEPFIDKFKGLVLNTHPSLLPSFKGLHAVRDALDYGVKISGCTIHFVDVKCDHGPIIIQKSVPVYDTDTEEMLAIRIMEWEKKAYSKAIELICDNNVNTHGRIVKIDDKVEF